MNIFGIIKRLSLKELFVLTGIMFSYPFYILPTFKATKKTLIVCDQYFKNNHHKNGIGNAFRHALWNVLICKYAFKINKNVTKSTNWAKKITDLHEKLAPNEPLENAMDLHNNEVGRVYFVKLKHNSLEEIVLFLEKKILRAKVVSDIKIMQNHNKDLVYLL